MKTLPMMRCFSERISSTDQELIVGEVIRQSIGDSACSGSRCWNESIESGQADGVVFRERNLVVWVRREIVVGVVKLVGDFGEVTRPFCIAGHDLLLCCGCDAGGCSLIREEEEGAILTVIEVRDTNRATQRDTILVAL